MPIKRDVIWKGMFNPNVSMLMPWGDILDWFKGGDLMEIVIVRHRNEQTGPVVDNRTKAAVSAVALTLEKAVQTDTPATPMEIAVAVLAAADAASKEPS